MNKLFLIILCIIGLGITLPAQADIESISAAIKGGYTNVQAQLKTVQDAADSVTKLKDTAIQGVTGIMGNINEIVDTATNPTSLIGDVKTSVMGGLKDAFDGSKNEDELVENVTENYTRVFGAENSITEAKKLQATINKNMGENAATLYGRTLVLRQELMNEENPEHSLETIQEALQASNEMVITSLRRWNKILEMQAYINEYKNSVAMQNFTRNAEDTADEE